MLFFSGNSCYWYYVVCTPVKHFDRHYKKNDLPLLLLFLFIYLRTKIFPLNCLPSECTVTWLLKTEFFTQNRQHQCTVLSWVIYNQGNMRMC